MLEESDAPGMEKEIAEKGRYTLGKFTLTREDLVFENKLPEDIIAKEFTGGIVYIDSKLDKRLFSEAMAREVVRRIQEMRKELSLKELEQIEVYIECSSEFTGYIKDNKKFIEHEGRKVSNSEFGQNQKQTKINFHLNY